MADRFDELMSDMAAHADKAVDYQAMHDSVLLEAKRRQKRRGALVRSLGAAAVFLLVASAGITAILSSGAKSAGDATLMAVAQDAPMAAAMSPEELESLTVDDSIMPPGCAPETCADPDEQAALTDSAADAGERNGDALAGEPEADMGVMSGSASGKALEDPADTAANLMLLSGGEYFTIGEPNFESCASICGYGREVLGDCAYTTLACEERVMDIGQAYIAYRSLYDGGEGIVALWQISDSEYVLVECGLPGATPEGIADILMGMAKQG